MAFVTLLPGELTTGAIYDILTGAIQPRPIAFVSSIDADGNPNLAPFSFFMPGGANPPSLVVSVTLGSEGRKKNTLTNIEATREFVVNTVVREMADGMNQTSFSYPHGTSEWAPGGFTSIPSVVVQPARVAESPISLECKLHEVVLHGSEAGAAAYIIGEVVAMHIDESIWSGGTIDARRFGPVSRLGGPDYLDLATLERFSLERPSSP